MNKEQGNKIKAAIDRTTIPEEMSLLYILANATDMMCHTTFQRIKSIYRINGFEIKENEMLTGIQNYCDMVRKAVFQFQSKIEPEIVGVTFGRGEGHNVKGYDGFQDDSRELCQLAIAYVDRTARNREAAQEVFKTLQALPSAGLFTEKDIKRYDRSGQ